MNQTRYGSVVMGREATERSLKLPEALQQERCSKRGQESRGGGATGHRLNSCPNILVLGITISNLGLQLQPSNLDSYYRRDFSSPTEAEDKRSLEAEPAHLLPQDPGILPSSGWSWLALKVSFQDFRGWGGGGTQPHFLELCSSIS